MKKRIRNSVKKDLSRYYILGIMVSLLLLINLPVATSYSIAQSNSQLLNVAIEKDKKINGLDFGEIFSFNIIPLISAEGESYCCPLTEDNFVCQPVSSNYENCPGGLIPSSCEQTSECRPGWCIDTSSGICSPSTRGQCVEGNGDFSTEFNSQICTSGCCDLGSTKDFTTRASCEIQGGSFDSSISEGECRFYSETNKGACVYNNQCVMTNENDCENTREGNFYENILCTNPELPVHTEPTDKTSCGNDGDVYYIDNAGNHLNIYDRNKRFDGEFSAIEQNEDIERERNLETPDAYWKYVFDKKETKCNSNNPENCGLCNYPLDSICKPDTENKAIGDYICKSLTCEYEGQTYKNGESWCVYDGIVGNVSYKYNEIEIDLEEYFSPFDVCEEDENGNSQSGITYCRENEVWANCPSEFSQKLGECSGSCLNGYCMKSVESEVTLSADTVGSEHYRARCEEGEIVSEACGEGYRGEICADSGDTDFRRAQCRVNEWVSCLNIGIEPYDYNNKGRDITDWDKKEEDYALCNSNPDCRVHTVNVDKFFKFDVCVPKYPKGFDTYSSESSENGADVCGLATQTCTYLDVDDNWFSNDAKCKVNCDCKTGEFVEKMNSLCVSLGDCGGYVNVVGDYEDDYGVSKYGARGTDLSDTYTEFLGALGMLPKWRGNVEDEGWNFADGEGNLSLINRISWQSIAISYAFSTVAGAGGGLVYAILFNSIYTTTISTSAGLGVGGAAGTATVTTTFSLGALLWPILIGIILLAAVNYFSDVLGLTSSKEQKVTFTCEPWTAPIGGEKCEECNGDPLRPCTEYKCQSLGSQCEFINSGTDYATCVAEDENDGKKPSVEFVSVKLLDEDVLYKDCNGNNGCTLDTNGVRIDEEIREGTAFNLTIKTVEDGEEELTRCAYSYERIPAGFDDIEDVYDNVETPHTSEHIFTLSIENNDEIFIRCQDRSGFYNDAEYVVQFSIAEEPDTRVPEIIGVYPADKSYIEYGGNSSYLEVRTRRAVNECRWSLGIDNSYEQMSNIFEFCDPYDSEEPQIMYTCRTTLTNLNQNTNDAFIKCQSLNGYNNTQSTPYTLYKTLTPLSITSILPNENQIGGGREFVTNLEARTSGGAYNGEAVCEYEFIESPLDFSRSLFFETGGTTHSQSLTLPTGYYNISITCRDGIPLNPNTAKAYTSFNLIRDTTPPFISRAYKDRNELVIITNEDSLCYYSNTNICSGFDFDQTTLMSSMPTTEHSTSWITGQTYYIKCKDIWENIQNSCGIIVRPTDF